MKFSHALFVSLIGLTLAVPVSAQVIYPLNRAEILAGSKFDVKVEFPVVVARDKVSVMLNGIDAIKALGGTLEFMDKEDGQEASSYLLRNVTLDKAGAYTLEAKAGDASAKVNWTVFDTPKGKVAKNVILFIGDGMSVAQRTAARMLSKGIEEGKYKGDLAMDDMPAMALVSTSGSDSVVTDSANSMSAYTSGHKTCVNALGVYCSRAKNNLDHPRVETISEIVKRKQGLSVGVVTNSEIEDATPAGMVSHTRKRADYNDIVRMFYDVKPDIIMGGGSPNFLPKATLGSKRSDEDNYIEKFKAEGYSFVSTATEMRAASQSGATKMLGLFNTGNVDGAYDQKFKKGTTGKFPDQPDLAEQTKIAIDALSKNDKGFVLMVESSRIDKYAHSLDWERSVYDTILLDNAVKVAKDYAAQHGDTLVIVVADHTHMVGIIGTYNDDLPGTTPREHLETYQNSKFPDYKPDANGYPETVDLKRRLAFTFGSYPDHCFDAKPHLDGEFAPAAAGSVKGTYVANETYCTPGSVKVVGNLPVDANSGVHSADDVILTAMGPGSDMFHGRLDNTYVFRAMTTALGLAKN